MGGRARSSAAKGDELPIEKSAGPAPTAIGAWQRSLPPDDDEVGGSGGSGGEEEEEEEEEEEQNQGGFTITPNLQQPATPRSIASPLFVHDKAGDPTVVLGVARLTPAGAVQTLGQIPGSSTEEGFLQHVRYVPGKYRFTPKTLDGKMVRGANLWMSEFPPDHPLIRDYEEQQARKSGNAGGNGSGNGGVDLMAFVDSQLKASEERHKTQMEFLQKQHENDLKTLQLREGLLADSKKKDYESGEKTTDRLVKFFEEDRKTGEARWEKELRLREQADAAKQKDFERKLAEDKAAREEQRKDDEARHRRELEAAEKKRVADIEEQERKRKADREDEDRRWDRRQSEIAEQRKRDQEDADRRRKDDAAEADARHKRTMEQLTAATANQQNPMLALIPLLKTVKDVRGLLGGDDEKAPAEPRGAIGEAVDLVKEYMKMQTQLEMVKVKAEMARQGLDLPDDPDDPDGEDGEDGEEGEETETPTPNLPVPAVKKTPIGKIDPVQKPVEQIIAERLAAAKTLTPKEQKTARRIIAGFVETHGETAKTDPRGLIQAAILAIEAEPRVVVYLQAVGLRLALLEAGCPVEAVVQIIAGARAAQLLDKLQIPEG